LEILKASDAELNQAVSKKALAAYGDFVPRYKARIRPVREDKDKKKRKRREPGDAEDERTAEERREASYALPTLAKGDKKDNKKQGEEKKYFNKGEKKRRKRAEKRKRQRQQKA